MSRFIRTVSPKNDQGTRPASRRHPRRRVAAALVAALGALVTMLSFAPAASATAPAPVLWTFSAAKQYSGNAAGYLLASRDRFCPPGKPIATNLTLTKALANARAIVVTMAGTKAVNAFDHSSSAANATAARTAAVGLFADRKPVPALLALLRVHQLQPADTSILSSIAALLNILGHPQEAFAIARSADAMPATPGQAMGISGQAMLLNNEGHAMLGLRRWADAERLLRQAVTASPELSEAKVNLAIAMLCQHEDEDAVKYFRLGQYRKAYPMVQVNDMPNPDTAPVATAAFDLSHGARGELPLIRIPDTWGEENTSGPVWARLGQEWSARLLALGNLAQKLEDDMDFFHLPLWITTRYSQVMIAAYSANVQPNIKPLYDRFLTTWDALVKFLGLYWHTENGLPAGTLPDLVKARDTWGECNQNPPNQAACEARWQRECANLNAATQAQWLPRIHAFDDAIRAYYRTSYRYMTAVVANLADPKLHQLAMVEVKRQMWADYIFLINRLGDWTNTMRFSNCNSTPSTDDPKQDDGTQESSEACAPFLKGAKFSVKLGDFVKLSTNCEQIGIEVSSKSDVLWAGLFGEGSYNFVKGTGTIFAGAKVGGKIPETGISVSAKEGFYMTIGGQGIKDVGMRVSTTGSYGLVGGAVVDVKGPAYQISWVSQTITFQ
jgi:tetratricopeptide (TPR) repeat protein